MTQKDAVNNLLNSVEKYADTIRYTVTGVSESGLVAHFYSINTPEISAVIRSFVNKKREKPARFALRIKDVLSGEQFEVAGNTAYDAYHKVYCAYQKHMKHIGARQKTQGTRVSAPDPMSYVTKQLLTKTKC